MNYKSDSFQRPKDGPQPKSTPHTTYLEALARCARELRGISDLLVELQVPAWLPAMGHADWFVEQYLILKEIQNEIDQQRAR